MSQSAAVAVAAADSELVFPAPPTHSTQAVIRVRNTGDKPMVYEIDTNSTPALHCDKTMGYVPAGGSERVPVRWSGSQRAGHDKLPHCDIHTAKAPMHAMSGTCVADNYWRIVEALNEGDGATTKLRVAHVPQPSASAVSSSKDTVSSTSMSATSATSRTTAVTSGPTSTYNEHSTAPTLGASTHTSATGTASVSTGTTGSTTMSAFDRAHLVHGEPRCDSATQIDKSMPSTHSTRRSSESAVPDDDAAPAQAERSAAVSSADADVEETQPAAVSVRRPHGVSMVSEATSADRRTAGSVRHRVAQWIERTIRGRKQSTNEELAERSLRGVLKDAEADYVQRCRRRSWRHRLADLVFGRYDVAVKSVTERHNAMSSAPAESPAAPSSSKRGGLVAWLRTVFAGGRRQERSGTGHV